MALTPSFELRQSQSLVMTPQLMQSIKLLQMTAAELEKFVEETLEKNPLLERDNNDETSSENSDESINEREITNNDVISQIGGINTEEEQNFYEAQDSSTLSNMFDGGDEVTFEVNSSSEGFRNDDVPRDWSSIGSKPLPLEDLNLIENIAEKPNLRDFVAEQIVFAFKTPAEQNIACSLAFELDEAGYFTGSIAKVAESFSVSEELVKKVLKRLQQFDPPGLFATSLSECLSLQLERQNRLDPAIKIVLENLPLLARRDFVSLAKLSGIDESEVVDILTEIRRLDPKPGLAYSQAIVSPVVPDVIVSKRVNGEFFVELNRAVLPKLVIHHDYAMKVGKNSVERSFMSDCFQNANWLIKALDQRERTLITVSAEIIRHQQEFLHHGIAFLKPLTLAMVAEAVHMHESTISRVTANKYVATPRGIFEMRSFFSSALQSAEGEEQYAADAVRHRIRELVDGENIDEILSDDMLVQILKKENIDIARRTVAKYREQMNISSSVLRRREKKAKLRTILD